FLDSGVRGPTGHQTFLHQILQCLGEVLEQNEAFSCQCRSYFSPPEVAQAISLDLPPAGPRIETAASPNRQPPDLVPLWALPTPHTQYSTTSSTSALGYTPFTECASTPTSLPQPSPTIFVSRVPKINETTWREVLIFI